VKTAFTGSFLRDVRKLPDEDIREQVRNAIVITEAAPDLRSVPNLKKLSGGVRITAFAWAITGSGCQYRMTWSPSSAFFRAKTSTDTSRSRTAAADGNVRISRSRLTPWPRSAAGQPSGGADEGSAWTAQHPRERSVARLLPLGRR
jgi:hypothetical protein